MGLLEEEKRGKHGNQIQISDNIRNNIKRHIDLFPRVEGHYVRKTSQREYLESGLSLQKMYRLYTSWCNENNLEKGKFWLYDDIFSSQYNISFHTPRKDQCTACREYEVSNEEKKAVLQTKYEAHIQNKELARTEKDNDKKKAVEAESSDKKYTAIVVDLQAVLFCPSGKTSILFYKRKLSVFNFTIFELATKKGSCFMWNETVAGRGANDIASCIKLYLEEKANNGYENVTIYSDGCGAQNRNRFLFTCYLYMVSSSPLQTIKHKYLESGHTQNEGDSMHSVIEKKLRGANIYVPEQYYSMVEFAKQNDNEYSVTVITQDDIKDFKALSFHNRLQLKWKVRDDHGEQVKWNKIMDLKVEKAHPYQLMYYFKYHHGDEYRVVRLRGRQRGRREIQNT